MVRFLFQSLAFLAVIAAFIFSGIENAVNRKVEPMSFDDFIAENTATTSLGNVSDYGSQSLISFEPVPEAENKKSGVSLPINKIIDESEKKFSEPTSVSVPVPQDLNVIEFQAISSKSISESQINLQSIALIKCIFRSQYYQNSSQPWGEERFSVGSGAVVSVSGAILTAKHLLEVPEELLNDPAGRKWSRIKCEIALTDKENSPITSIGSAGNGVGERFQEAEIIFNPSDKDYIGAKGLDFVILKTALSGENYAQLFPYLIEFSESDKMVLIGYPGRDSLVSQKLERFDGQFQILTFYKESLCGFTNQPCGLRYVFKRYPNNFEKDFWKSTDLGIITPYFRGGFSGAPAFYNGNLIGIATHGISGSEAKDGWDQAVILTSWDIFEFLKRNNVTF